MRISAPASRVIRVAESRRVGRESSAEASLVTADTGTLRGWRGRGWRSCRRSGIQDDPAVVGVAGDAVGSPRSRMASGWGAANSRRHRRNGRRRRDGDGRGRRRGVSPRLVPRGVDPQGVLQPGSARSPSMVIGPAARWIVAAAFPGRQSARYGHHEKSNTPPDWIAWQC